MDLETARALLADDLGNGEPAPPQLPLQPPALGNGQPLAMPNQGLNVPPGGPAPDFQFGPTGDIEKYQAWRSKQPFLARAFLPEDMAQGMAMAATGGMAPEAKLGLNVAREGIMPLARGVLSRLGVATGAGMLGAKAEGKPALGGAIEGLATGIPAEGIYGLQRGIGTSRLGQRLVNEIPERISAVAQQYAPWLPQFGTPVEFLRSFMHPNRPGTGAQAVISATWRDATDQIDQALAQQGGTNLVTRFAPQPNANGTGVMPGTGYIRAGSLRIPAPTTFQEARDALDLLGRAATNQQEQIQRGVTPTVALRMRDQLLEDVNTHLSNFGLDDAFNQIRNEYGRAKSLTRLLSQKGVIENGRVNRQALQESWQNLGPERQDIDARWAPHELDELERALFGEAPATMTDIPGKAPRIRTAFTTRHIPPVFADPPTIPVFAGERPLFPWTPPQYTHLGVQVGERAMNAANQPQPVVFPDSATSAPVDPSGLAAKIRSDPRSKMFSDEEIQAAIAAAMRKQ